MKPIYSIILLFIFINSAFSQNVDQKVANSCVYIQYPQTNNQSKTGSGFLIFKPIKTDDNKESGHIFLITNKHVLPMEGIKKDIEIRFAQKIDSNIVLRKLSIPVVDSKGKYTSKVILHKDSTVDVVAINISNQISNNNIRLDLLHYDLILDEIEFDKDKIFIGTEIYILGYPDGIYENSNATPVLRSGVISTIPNQNYSFNARMQKLYSLPAKLNGFLIDSKIFPGSSGSLVILKSEYLIEEEKNGEPLFVKRPNFILGIVSGSIPMFDLGINTAQRIGLGVVYSSNTIKEVIDDYYK
jgi:hypothetical protein